MRRHRTKFSRLGFLRPCHMDVQPLTSAQDISSPSGNPTAIIQSVAIQFSGFPDFAN